MKAIYIYLVGFLFCIQVSTAQVGIGTASPDPSSELDVSSPLNDKGVLIPRMNQAERNLIASPATSLLIYQTDNTPGFYYFNGTIWVGITAGASTNWTLVGNTGTSAATNFIGTTDDVDIVIKRNNIQAGLIGNPVAAPLTTANRRNTSFGANSLLTPVTGYRNTAIGSNVLTNNAAGFRNTAVGDASMASNTAGVDNSAIGVGALFSNTTGNNNTAIGRNALTANTTAGSNTALGNIALQNNTTGTLLTAAGAGALIKNTDGNNNTAFGVQAVGYNTTGDNNTGVGFQALGGTATIAGNVNVSTGDNNSALGYQSFYNNLTGSGNVGLGYQSGLNELTSNKLYIENSSADASNALIYGEFDTNILRTNSTFQIGNPAAAGTGYAFPTVRPATVANQILQYSAVGALTFQTPAAALNSSAWLTTGNTGMVAATNFIGTTDANPLVFRTSNVERMRIVQTSGLVVVGAIAPFTGDKFSAYGTGTEFAVNGYSTLTGVGVYGENSGSGLGVYGNATGTGVGVEGDSTGTGFGVFGFNDGTGIAVFGNNTTNGVGVQGQSIGNNSGVFGFNNANGRGVFGRNTSTGVGVQGESVNTGAGVFGFNNAAGQGVVGQNTSTGTGVFGINTVTGIGVRGQSVTTGTGVLGTNSGTGTAVRGNNTGTGRGIEGNSTAGGLGVFGTNSGTGNGVQGDNASTGNGVFGANTSTGNGVVGQTPAASTAFAVFANGNMGASGTKPFYIDHPTDPANKYLRHFAIESNEVLNVYRGNVLLNASGEATVTLPNYFDDVNINFSYNLTSIGGKSEVFIKQEITNNQFIIAGGNPNQKISWQVYAERNDAYLQQYPDNKTVEVDKRAEDKGKYLMPELYNQPDTKGIFNQTNHQKSQDVMEISEEKLKVFEVSDEKKSIYNEGKNFKKFSVDTKNKIKVVE